MSKLMNHSCSFTDVQKSFLLERRIMLRLCEAYRNVSRSSKCPVHQTDRSIKLVPSALRKEHQNGISDFYCWDLLSGTESKSTSFV